jgi:hypothetical protein
MTQYSLTCINGSNLSGSFAVFQKPLPLTTPGNVFSLAWLAKPVHSGSQVTFTWTVDYNFVWSETGILQPGVNFQASEVIPADPEGQNLVQLAIDDYGATYFSKQDSSGAAGSLTIKQVNSVVPNRTSVGVGMSGAGTFVVQASPNMTTVFTPHPNYWVLFGNYQPGDVMDIEDLSGAQEITFGGSLTSRTAALDLSNLISVS